MADFAQWVQPGKRRYRRIQAGYQNLYNDSGNWTGCAIGSGIQAGTNMSISACWLAGELGRPVTAAEMQALTIAQALGYYKTGFWDKVMGDQFKSQILAEFVADMKSSAGGNGVKEFQKALGDVGNNVPVDGSFGNQTLQAANDAVCSGKELLLYNAFRVRMIQYYNRIGTGSNAGFLPNWLSSLDDDYPQLTAITISNSCTSYSNPVQSSGNNVLMGLGLISLAGLIWWNSSKN